jgi:hypothetical protein
MVSGTSPDQSWSQLSSLAPAEREAQMAARYKAMAGLGEDERRNQVKSMILAEYSLNEPELRAFTISRMRTWIALDPEEAPVIAQSYDAVMQEMPATIAMKRVSLVQTLVLEFSAEEEARLRELVPRVFAGAPSRSLAVERPAESAQDDKASKKPWWKFWG